MPGPVGSRSQIHGPTRLRATAGVSVNRFRAKPALTRPDALTTLRPPQVGARSPSLGGEVERRLGGGGLAARTVILD
ncbi:hypothetical protein LAJ19_08925 [Deinococcus taeanensis]|uniref:hypothetical protein n=1 Tax=Deinococcus taeanensis TaxID=2737050 RepID=UPI001CDB677C|nr:hypothetical protein [Deinococcus taeanensis]UBV41774.1 hypothetical protein LAJ19_08925 [Deinococcus taeanensis]